MTASITIVSTISQADDFMFVSFMFFGAKEVLFKRWLLVIAHEWSKLKGCLQNVCFCTVSLGNLLSIFPVASGPRHWKAN